MPASRLPHPRLLQLLTLSGCTTSTARRYCFFTCPGVTRSAMLTGVQRCSPSHSTVCNVDSSARMFLSLPSIQSRSCRRHHRFRALAWPVGPCPHHCQGKAR